MTGPYVVNLVWGLFGKSNQASFELPEASRDRINNFINSDETFDATKEYIKQLSAIYAAQNLGHALNPIYTNQNGSKALQATEKAIQPEPRRPAGNVTAAGSRPANGTETPIGQPWPIMTPSFSTFISGQDEQEIWKQSRPGPATAPPTLAPQSPATQPEGSAPINRVTKPGQIPPGKPFPERPADPKASFQIPNAKFGVPYIGKIEGKDSTGVLVRVRDPKLRQDLGLTFDEASGELKGTPTGDGDCSFTLQWSSDGSSWSTGECSFFINPDPRSLWKCLEPDPNEPYQKPHLDSSIVNTPTQKIVAASRRGRSHEHSGTFRDDDFYIAYDPVANWSVIIVADGAGSAKSSRWGSKLAVKAFGNHLQSELSGQAGRQLSLALAAWPNDPDSTSRTMGTAFQNLFHKAGTLAVQAIEAEAKSKSSPVKEYSTTLLAAVARSDGDALFVSTFWIGDGAIAAYGPRGKVRLMGTPDSGEFAGQTRFLDIAALDDAGFAKRIGIGRFTEIDGLLLMTDGVSDPRFETDAGLANADLWDGLWDEISPLLTSEKPDKAMVDWLHFFTAGHHDDRTIAVLLPSEIKSPQKPNKLLEWLPTFVSGRL